MNSGTVIEKNKSNRKNIMKFKENRNDGLEVNPNFGRLPDYFVDMENKKKIEKHKQ